MRKKMKQYLEAMTALNEAKCHLSKQLSECQVVQTNDEFRKAVEDEYSISVQIGKTIQETKSMCQKNFIDPLKNSQEDYTQLEEGLKNREELVEKWKFLYARVQKLQERKDRMASTIAKLQYEKRTEEAAAKELKECHAQLISYLQNTVEQRIDLIKPCVRELMKIQMDYYGYMTNMHAQLSTKDENDDTGKSFKQIQEECKKNIAAQFDIIKGLAIVKHD